MKVIAVDWSGRATGEAEYIWAATAEDGRLRDLWNGRTREQVTDWLVSLVDGGPLVVGLDFAFSFPRWWCERSGWKAAKDVWIAAEIEGERWLHEAAWPFWGRPGCRCELHEEERLRCSERRVRGAAKSVFQIGGAGAVGTGSIRGMPMLLRLARAGYAIWPFDPAESATVVEIYPRALTLGGQVQKGRWSQRHAYLNPERFPGQPQTLLERAAGSEDAFDATVSALTMGAHAHSILTLPAGHDLDSRIEGRIWTPPDGLGGRPRGPER